MQKRPKSPDRGQLKVGARPKERLKTDSGGKTTLDALFPPRDKEEWPEEDDDYLIVMEKPSTKISLRSTLFLLLD